MRRYLCPKPQSPSSSSGLAVIHVSLLRRGSHSSARSKQIQIQEEDVSRRVRVSVWWDFENCNVPSGVNVFKVASAISAAVRANGIKGPVEITAFGDMLQLSRAKQEGLSSTGVNLAHIPRDGKNSIDRSILANLMYWVSQNPPPAHLFLISGDKTYAGILHRLRMSNYNILLASPDKSHGVLCSAASIMWDWNDLLQGDNLTGKVFNQPPDGPYNSWYGNYKVPILDPFLSEAKELPTKPDLVTGTDSHSHQSSTKPDPVTIADSPSHQLFTNPKLVAETDPPSHHLVSLKAVKKKICQILRSSSDGTTAGELCKELCKIESFDKVDYYGYKRFTLLLSSMEGDILKLGRNGNGNHMVYHVSQSIPDVKNVGANGRLESGGNGKSVENRGTKTPLSSPTKLNEKDMFKAQNNSHLDMNTTKKVDSTDGHVSSMDEKILETVKNEKIMRVVDGEDQKIDESDKALESENVFRFGDEKTEETNKVPESVHEKIVEAAKEPESESTFPVVVQLEHSSSEPSGFFKRFWRKWLGSETSDSNKSREGETKSEEDSKPIVGFSNPSSPSSPLSQKAKSDSSSTEKVKTSPGFVERIRNWFKDISETEDKPLDHSQKDISETEDRPLDHSSEGENTIRRNEIFLKQSFWSTMESFMKSPLGSRLVSESKTRQQMAEYLHTKGPYCLLSLEESDLLHLVDLLIAEKKWIKECPSETLPFKISLFKKSLSPEIQSQTEQSNFKTSFFKKSPPNQDENERESENASSLVDGEEEKNPEKTRDEVLADCQNLVNEIMKLNPKGFFVGLFRKQFVEKYGYHLNFQKLGYHGLIALLSSMSGVKIKSGHMVSVENAPRNGSNGADSAWEELGPITDTKSNPKPKRAIEEKSEVVVKPSPKPKVVSKKEQQTDFEYEPAISEDELSDTEEEQRPVIVNHKKIGVEANSDSSLLNILDAWHGTKESDRHRKNKANIAKASKEDFLTELARKSEKADEMLDLVSEFGKFSSEEESSKITRGRKLAKKKSISFVMNSESGNNDDERKKLADDVMRNLRPSKESSSEKEKETVLQ